MTNLSKAERETIIRWSAEDEPVTVMTHERTAAERLIRAGATVAREGTRGNCAYWILECPREWRRYPRKPRGGPARVITPEQIAKMQAGRRRV